MTEKAAAAVTESRAFTDREASEAVTVSSAHARLERLLPTWRQSGLGAIAHPQVAYLLLAFFAFQVLPINESVPAVSLKGW